MADPLKKGEEMGKGAANPVARYIRNPDSSNPLTPPEPTAPVPFWHMVAKGKTIAFGIVVGDDTSSAAVQFDIKKWTLLGVSTIKSFSLDNWTAGDVNIISNDEVDLDEGDVLACEIQNVALEPLPGLMVFVVLELG